MGEITTNIKFVVRVDRSGTRDPAYVQGIDLTPMQMTTNRKKAQIIGKLTTENTVKSMQDSGFRTELARPGWCLTCCEERSLGWLSQSS
jgi:hypothetical protein